MKIRRSLARIVISLCLVVVLRAAVPSPESHFGHKMAADRTLLDWNKVVSYFDSLQRSSDRIRVEELGPTAEGRPLIAAFIASPGTIRNLDSYRDIQARLADPRRTPAAEAEKLFSAGKTVVMITCSIHSTEVASTMTAVELAYKLISEDKPKYKAILDNVIFILVPSLNPDGVDIVTAWYRKTLGTAYEGTNPPELYQKYVGHDNNRDWYIFSQPETRLVVSKLHNVWHPQIVYDVHQQGAYGSRMFVPPWLDPIDPNVDPIVAQLQNAVGAQMAADLTTAGKTGVAINAMYDFWTPSRHYQAYHGGLRVLSESASAKLATPLTVRPDELNRTALGYSPRERSWNYLEPWTGGTWRVRDIIDYQLIAMESCLYQAAMRREDFLRSFFRIGQKAVARTTPYAFVVPREQADPGAARVLLDTLRFGQIEVDRTSAAFRAGNKNYSPGTYVVHMTQPYSSWAKTLLERQVYPDLRLYPGGPPRRPYDVTAQTLPLLMGVTVDTISSPFEAPLVRASKFDFASPETNQLRAADTGTWHAVNRAWRSNGKVWRDPTTGNFALQALPGFRERRAPRIGLYKSFVPSMDEGWTRWLLEQFGFAYRNVGNADLHEPNLIDRFDVLLFSDQKPQTMQNGYAPGTMPEEYTGGIGEEGTEAIKEFASRGGTVVFLNDASGYAVEYLGLGVKDVLAGVPNRDFYAPGSLLNIRLDTTHPLTYGLPRDLSAWFEESPAFDLPAGARAVAVYPDRRLLASGWLLGEKYLFNRAAIVDVPVGSGHIVLFGMRPQYRAQSYLTFKLLFNSFLLSG